MARLPSANSWMTLRGAVHRSGHCADGFAEDALR
jgi:hypothetical protein